MTEQESPEPVDALVARLRSKYDRLARSNATDDLAWTVECRDALPRLLAEIERLASENAELVDLLDRASYVSAQCGLIYQDWDAISKWREDYQQYKFPTPAPSRARSAP